jgi:hypothetical protein
MNCIVEVLCFDFCVYLCCPIVIFSLLDCVTYYVCGCTNMEAWNEMLLGKCITKLGNNESEDFLQLLFDVDVDPKVAR